MCDHLLNSHYEAVIQNITYYMDKFDAYQNDCFGALTMPLYLYHCSLFCLRKITATIKRSLDGCSTFWKVYNLQFNTNLTQTEESLCRVLGELFTPWVIE